MKISNNIIAGRPFLFWIYGQNGNLRFDLVFHVIEVARLKSSGIGLSLVYVLPRRQKAKQSRIPKAWASGEA